MFEVQLPIRDDMLRCTLAEHTGAQCRTNMPFAGEIVSNLREWGHQSR